MLFEVLLPITGQYTQVIIEADDRDAAIAGAQSYHGSRLRARYTDRSKGSEFVPKAFLAHGELRDIYQKDGEQEAREAAKTLLDFVNAFGYDHTSFVDELHQGHRTLQQSATQLVLKWLYSLAEVEHCDLRNEAAVNAARKIKEALGDFGDHLPLV